MGPTHTLAVYNMKVASLHLVQATNNGQQTVKTGMRRFYFTSHGKDLTSIGVQNNARLTLQLQICLGKQRFLVYKNQRRYQSVSLAGALKDVGINQMNPLLRQKIFLCTYEVSWRKIVFPFHSDTGSQGSSNASTCQCLDGHIGSSASHSCVLIRKTKTFFLHS